MKEFQEKLAETHVTYTIGVDGQLIVIENVPAWVNVEIGEQLFSPETMDHLQQMVREQHTPKRIINSPYACHFERSRAQSRERNLGFPREDFARTQFARKNGSK